MTNLKEFQGQVEKLQAGTKIIVNVQRSNGKDEYREIPFELNRWNQISAVWESERSGLPFQ